MPKYQFVPIAPDGRRGEAVAVPAWDDAVAMKRALILPPSLPGAVAWDIWRGVKHVACIAAPVDVGGRAEAADLPAPVPAQAQAA
ncbi:hypothetical protein LRS10_04320 [Phenylobacterium sp. J426]|uniref:hypothetical protein n=1 Tax=Phenylobacterium sp. J426 TaxID=2898439 RepID=UPI002151C729|nr:hypothetical protein [Phenylobacterium sp. J426]MCR5873475.1 hypothetical protein [Phenylobacterium sp. J426]